MKNYCETCGTKLTIKQHHEEGLTKYCPNCDKFVFNQLNVAIITLVVNELNQVLLIKQNHINPKYYILVAGYVKPKESLEDAVRREVFEETNQIAQKITYIMSKHYEKKDILMPAFLTTVTKQEFNNSGEVDQLAWFSLDDAKEVMNHSSYAFEILSWYINNQTKGEN